MAVSIDTVYQKVLALANKEQRGYITPQEFNLFADMAQKEIFDQYFYDLNQFKRVPGNDTEYADIVGLIEEKINVFRRSIGGYANGMVLPYNNPNFPNFYQITNAYVSSLTQAGYSNIIEEISVSEAMASQNSPLTKAHHSRPVYYLEQSKIYFFPSVVAEGYSYNIKYIDRPVKPSWSYMVVNGKALYNSTASTDFELHLSEESELTYKILKFAGISMKKQDITQAGQGLESTQVSQEKQ